MFACFYSVLSLFLLLLFFLLFLLLGTVQSTEISHRPPLRHIKQSLVPTTVSFVFPLWLSSCFSAGQQINTDLGEKRRGGEKKAISYCCLKWLPLSCLSSNPSLHLCLLPVSPLTPALHGFDKKRDALNDGGVYLVLDQAHHLFSVWFLDNSDDDIGLFLYGEKATMVW